VKLEVYPLPRLFAGLKPTIEAADTAPRYFTGCGE
jgi:hypothetical protein